MHSELELVSATSQATTTSRNDNELEALIPLQGKEKFIKIKAGPVFIKDSTDIKQYTFAQ